MELIQTKLNPAAGIVFFILGLVLIASGNAAGWVSFILGITFIARASDEGKAFEQKHPTTVRWVLIGLLIFTILVTVVILISMII